MRAVRCAIYTRKSSEEGLEQGFNSLDAQREACAAYILSQASEGWSALPALYDDGGISGGTLDRPALKRLITDIEAGMIDIVVVYKVDRLSRSLFDFAKLVETFDKAKVSFVSITQSFNTTTSMGRLTLNMLLSFAQFEREVTAERIRDKIAASKAKGMWLGGTTPLGYAPDGRTLAIVEDHAALIRTLFANYLKFGNVRLLHDWLRDNTIRVPARVRKSGASIGGGWFSRGQLYQILRNPVYNGEIKHGDKLYPGQHPPIIDCETRDRVRAMLSANGSGAHPPRIPRAALLRGLISDNAGEPMLSVHATHGTVRYRYYVSKAMHHKLASTGYRIPARALENLVVEMVGQQFDDPLALAGRLALELRASEIETYLEICVQLKAKIMAREQELLRSMIRAVRVLERSVVVEVDTAAVATAAGHAANRNTTPELTLRSGATLKKSGRVLRLVDATNTPVQPSVDPSLVRLIAKAYRWWGLLKSGESSVTGLAASEGVTKSYVTRVVRLAFLSPRVTTAILEGRHSTRISHRALTATGAIALD